MLNMGQKLAAAGVSGSQVQAQPKATFADGRMAAKDAWNYCTAVCGERGVQPPTLRTFKWHLRHGQLTDAAMRPNPFGGHPEKVAALTVAQVIRFADAWENDGDKMRVETQPKHAEVPPTTAPEKARAPVAAKSPVRELSSRLALAYVQSRVGPKCELNSTTFGFYLAYDVIPSRWEGKQRMVNQEDLDAFLELAPTGVQADHMQYEVGLSLAPGQLSMREAYAYYASVDPNPVTLNTFRSLVATGVILAIRTANASKAPVIGFKKGEIDGFLARRHRIMEKNRESPSTKGFLTRKEREATSSQTSVSAPVAAAIEEALDAAQKKLGLKPETVAKKAPKKVSKKAFSKAPEGRWAPIKEAYAYYQRTAVKPLTESWFRNKCYRTGLFGKRVIKDERPNNPTGKKYLIDLDTIDVHLSGDTTPKAKPQPQRAWPVEKAFHKFKELIPPGLSLLQFKRLVNNKIIRSFTRNTVVHVRLDAVEEYFKGDIETDVDTVLQMGGAYDYYCSRCTDPVAKAHFSRWVTSGEISGAEKNDEGLWIITMAAIDSFIDNFPTGRLRTNKNSRAVVGVGSGKKGSKKLAQEVERVRTETAPPVSAGTVSISMKSYSSPAAMKKALDLLTSQGFEVDVKP